MYVKQVTVGTDAQNLVQLLEAAGHTVPSTHTACGGVGIAPIDAEVRLVSPEVGEADGVVIGVGEKPFFSEYDLLNPYLKTDSGTATVALMVFTLGDTMVWGAGGAGGDDGSSKLTFLPPVPVHQVSPGIFDLGTVLTETDVVRLHELAFTVGSQGKVVIGYDDDGAGLNAVALTGPMTLGAGGGVIKQYIADPRGTFPAIPDAVTQKHLTLTFTTALGDVEGAGWAIISKGPAIV
jgi:hypothetical protein